jgi:class 3 adenylate cyclase
MYDLNSDAIARGAIEAMVQTQQGVITKSFYKGKPNLWNTLWGSQSPTWGNLMVSPVFANNAGSTKVIGSVVFDLDWTFISGSTVPFGSQGIQIVLENSCGQHRTFASNGNTIVYVGDGDLHDPTFSDMFQQSTFEEYRLIQSATAPHATGETSHLDCAYRITVYSSEDFRSSFLSHKPRLYALVVFMIFVFTSLLFVAYDCYVSRRQRKVMSVALQRDEIVSSLFPTAVRERLFSPLPPNRIGPIAQFQKAIRSIRLKNNFQNIVMAQTDSAAISTPRMEAIADYFPMVSIVFADISGFTAWSSEREPSQVFELLETVYQAFDKLVKRIGIFKVETSGDCYVAAAGIPCHQADHAVRAVRFAYECVLQMHQLTRQLESLLGPSTLSLSIRIGVHSGPVIGGVLRGDKYRFQLFGDTMNTASRLQTTGEINMIQISSATARFLEEADKSNWIHPRNEPVRMKGKGLVQTFWADPLMSEEDSNTAARDSTNGDVLRNWGETRLSTLVFGKSSEEDKMKRLVEWNADLLMRLLRNVVASRPNNRRRRQLNRSASFKKTFRLPFEDVADILAVEPFPEKPANDEMDPQLLDIGENERAQLVDYVADIASMYRDNPFHNFEHASHVAMSAAKVVMRIIRPDNNQRPIANRKERTAWKKQMHNNTFGISSDVLLQFAVVFSAVIHDVDHSGVSNAQLVKEGHDVALRYHNKSVAEQNSVDIAWKLLIQDKYKDLFHCICPNERDQQRFRQLLVNAVISTDIADKELQQARKDRWDRAFKARSETRSEPAESVSLSKDDMDRKATIVFDYIIQASDVAHTMQHWKVYKQWNERLFEERYKAYLQGREVEDPAIGWYQGEVWFFDNYVIPLAKKLETCGVFGVSSDEYLSYALENRHEWELKGNDIVKSMVKKCSISSSSRELGSSDHEEQEDVHQMTIDL